jgi:NAD/NADP transhydrogenase alpha subunit
MNFVTRTFRTLGRTVRGAVTATAEVPTAALVVSTIGMFGLVDWPIVVSVSAGALVLQRIARTPDESSDVEASQVAVPSTASNGSGPPKTSRKAPSKGPGRRTGTA